ncbi:hypothetical protein DMR_41780 [Solidesulfovibrio magneticus RS-1]|uniref:Uncharacterized protein n=1 Tax=Solidesulfovibrio magneticus (strain ATCC 700980 / DSM 13731 / RS-1) TaxID=573370 RepID=C4XPW9_SOLM1|nr:hypothetical protein DMR_41780 [Solidesulfovibrio magneticus RS-1]
MVLTFFLFRLKNYLITTHCLSARKKVFGLNSPKLVMIAVFSANCVQFTAA